MYEKANHTRPVLQVVCEHMLQTRMLCIAHEAHLDHKPMTRDVRSDLGRATLRLYAALRDKVYVDISLT